VLACVCNWVLYLKRNKRGSLRTGAAVVLMIHDTTLTDMLTLVKGSATITATTTTACVMYISSHVLYALLALTDAMQAQLAPCGKVQ
jgi:hypothetical protein